MKRIGYIIFALMYYIGCLFPVRQNRFFCIMTHDGSDDSSVGVVIKEIKRKRPDSEFICIRKSDKRLSCMISLIFRRSFELASSSMVLMDNEFLPFAYVRPRRNIKIVQLWHGTGTIKKFGHDISEGRMLKLVERADNRITHLIVNSDYTARLYQKIFEIDADKVYVTGIPRTDVMFDPDIMDYDLKRFYNEYPELKEKRLVLYAPTFRDDQIAEPCIELDLNMWDENIDNNTVLLLRLHPHVASSFDSSFLQQFNSHIFNMSDYDDLNVLLFAADILITDYSSIVFEYALLDRPMYFYAYDIVQFEHEGRGFYENYDEFVPGKVIRTTEELINSIDEEDTFNIRRIDFVNTYYKYTDGKSTERLLRVIL